MLIRSLHILALAGLLAGCGGAAPVTPEGGEPAGRVRFMVFGDPAEKAAYETLVAAFEERRPAVDIELQHIPSQADYRQRLGADFAAGNYRCSPLSNRAASTAISL